MATVNLLRHLGARHGPFLFSASVLLGGFEFLICAVVASANLGGAIEALTSTLPPILQSVITSQMLGGLTPQGLLAFGWNHPVAHALGGAVGIVLATRAVAGEVETGAIEVLLSQPLSRRGYFAAQVGFALLALALLSLAGVAGTLLGQRAFELEPFGAAACARLAASYFLLQCDWFGIALALSAFGREAGRVASVGFLIVLTSYLAQVIGTLWERAAFVLPYALHHYFSPRSILVEGEAAARPVAVLSAVFAASVSVAWLRFRRRDLP